MSKSSSTGSSVYSTGSACLSQQANFLPTSSNHQLQKQNLQLSAENAQLKLELLELKESNQMIFDQLLRDLSDKDQVIQSLHNRMEQLILDNERLMMEGVSSQEEAKLEKRNEIVPTDSIDFDDFEIIDEVSLYQDEEEPEQNFGEELEETTSNWSKTFDVSAASCAEVNTDSASSLEPPPYEAVQTNDIFATMPRQSTKTDLAQDFYLSSH